MLEDYWYIVCISKQLKRHKPLATKLMGKQIVLYRTKSGEPCALEDRCAHRNAPLSKGIVTKTGCLQCPYHGWTYDDRGHLAFLPAENTNKNLSNIHIKKYQCKEQQGYIWVTLSDNPAQEPYTFPGMDKPEYTTFSMHKLVHANIDLCLENVLDLPHANFVHKGLFRTYLASKLNVKVKTLSDGVIAEFTNEPRNKSLVFRITGLASNTMVHTDRFIAPATTQVDYKAEAGKHYIISSSFTPLDDKITIIYTATSLKLGILSPIIRLFMEPVSHIVIRQDQIILNQTQHNIHQFGNRSYKIRESDVLAAGIMQWRTAIKKGIPPPKEGVVKDVTIFI